ncbi:MAG TPA: hypothetical protein VMX55_05675 [candidate division Zixibacteria bacterium]|nr:hypothetical protein [candidate division Zixibacteria bacterium]
MSSSSSKKTLKINLLINKAPIRYHNNDYNKITRDNFEKLIPDTVPGIIKEDIAFYFNYLRNNRSKKSLREWETAISCVDSPNSWKAEGYRPIFAFLYYDRITDGLFLPLLLRKLELTQKNKKKISIEEFNHLCRLSIIGFRPSIDAIDQKILQMLTNEPSLVTQALTDKIDHSYATVYNHLQDLKAKMGLRIVTRINWSKLGVQRIFLITNNEKYFEKFTEFKTFIDGQSAFLWGETYFLRYYLLNEKKREAFIDKYASLSILEKQKINLLELAEAPNSGYSFELYDLKEQKWQFDFTTSFLDPKLITDQLKQIKQRELFSDKYPPDEIYELSAMEIKILSGLVGSYDVTQKDLADSLKIHAPNLSIIKTKLLADSIINPQLEVSTFLPLSLILWCSALDKEIIDIITFLMHKIPYSNISPVTSFNEPEKYQMICYLMMDDVLYYSLVTFLMDLLKEKRLDDFRLGIITDGYYSMSHIEEILKNE